MRRRTWPRGIPNESRRIDGICNGGRARSGIWCYTREKARFAQFTQNKDPTSERAASRNDASQLRFEHVQRAFGPNNVIREQHLLFNGQLRGDALVDLFIVPAALAQALALCLRGTRRADGRIAMTRRIGLEQQRNQGNCRCTAFGAPGLQLALPDGADSWMKDFFQFSTGAGVGENAFGQFAATQPAIVTEDFPAEQLPNFSKRGLDWLNDLAGDDVRINERQAAPAQPIGCSRFSHADPARET